MKILIRGVPNFSRVTPVEADDLTLFLSQYEFHLGNTRGFGPRADYMSAGKRVMVYLLGAPENLEALESAAFDRNNAFYLKTARDGEVTATGSDFKIQTDRTKYYLINPTSDPRYPAALDAFNAEQSVKRSQRQVEAEREELEAEHREQALDDVVDRLGHQGAMSILRGAK